MTWKGVLPLALAVLGLLPSRGTLAGQEGSFAFQIRGGGALPVGAFRSAEEGWEGRAGRGTSFGMGFTFPVLGPLGGYLGFGQRRFQCDDAVCPSGKYWTSTGFDVAARTVIGRSRIRLWTQAGLHTHRMEGRIRLDGKPHHLTSEGGAGFELGGGVLIQIGRRTSLSPGLWYGQGHVPFTGRASMQPRYLIMDLGLVMGF